MKEKQQIEYGIHLNKSLNLIFLIVDYFLIFRLRKISPLGLPENGNREEVCEKEKGKRREREKEEGGRVMVSFIIRAVLVVEFF